MHLPFPGSPAAVTALLRGDVQVAVLPAGSVAELGKAGKLKMLAVTSATRSPLLPELPTLGEAGIANVEGRRVGGADRSGRHQRCGAGQDLRTGSRRARRSRGGRQAQTPEQFRAVLKQEHDRWAPVIAAGGIKAE